MSYFEQLEEPIDVMKQLQRENKSLRSALDEYRAMLNKYRTLAECSLAGIYVVQNDRFQYVNPRFMEMLGYEREEDLIGLDFWEVIHEEDRAMARNPNLRKDKIAGYPDRFTVRAIRKNGSVAWLDLSKVVGRYMDQPADIGTVVDITEQKETEEALLQSEEKYRTIIEQIEEGYYETDLQGNLTFINDSFVRILGYPRDELLGMNYVQYTAPEVAHRINVTFDQVYATGLPARAIAWEIRRKDGTKRHIELSSALMKDRGGRGIGFRGMARDITERKQVEGELHRHRYHLEDLVRERSAELIDANEHLMQEVAERKRAQEKLLRETSFSDSVIDSMPGVFYLFDQSGNMVRWNEFFEDISGYDSEEVGRMNALEFFVEEDRPLVRERINKSFSAGRASVEARVLTKNDDPIPFYLTGMRIELDSQVYLVGVGVDITERKRAEDALIASEKELRVLSTQLIDAQEKERQYIAMELHDGIGQALTAIKVGVERVIKTVEGISTSEKMAPLNSLIPIIQQSVEEVRRMSMELRPSMLDKLGILPTISWFYRHFDNLYPTIAVEKNIRINESDIPEHLKIVIYRIIQEASNNVAKHSQADKLTIRLGCRDKAIELLIQDTGNGFDLDSTLAVDTAQRGFGLASMRERTVFSGGRYELLTSPGNGTTIKAVWPLEGL